MRTCSTRRSLLFPLVTKHFVTFFAITYFTSVTRLNEVECASLLPQRPHQQDDITMDDNELFHSLQATNNNNEFPVASNPNNHNMITRYESIEPKHKALMRRKRQQYVSHIDADNHIPSHLTNIIPDIDLLRRLLRSGLLSADIEDRPGSYYHRRTGVPNVSYRLYPSKQMPIHNEPAKRQGGCLFHGGLAHNCDYKDLVGAVDETDHWGSDLSPGKKK